MAEDMSPRVGAFGDPVAVTPNIDRLASEGVRYPNTFTTAGVCAPSRAAHITGVHQMALGAQHMRSYQGGYRAVPPPEVKAYPELLRAAGYHTFTHLKLDYQFSKVGAGSGPFTIWDREGSTSSGLAGAGARPALLRAPQLPLDSRERRLPPHRLPQEPYPPPLPAGLPAQLLGP